MAMDTISDTQWKVFRILLDSEKFLSIQEIAARAGMEQPMIAATLSLGQEQGWLTFSETVREEVTIPEAAADRTGRDLPERWMLVRLADRGRMPMQDIAPLAKADGVPLNEVIKWGLKRGWFRKSGDSLEISDRGRRALEVKDDDERVVDMALEAGAVFSDELSGQGIDFEKFKAFLGSRPSAVRIRTRSIRSARLTDRGRQDLKKVRVVKEKNVLAAEDIASGEWRNIRLRRYDVTVEAEKAFPAKIHPMQKIIRQTRQAFLEMGFTEIVSPQVESAFWDFDALFQPQDHPARDMQDTFYMSRPEQARLPDKALVEQVRRTHEDGGETGSKGWGYQWSLDRAGQTVLRTHTTATTIRALAGHPHPPLKVFCVGKVFRNEAVSYKHLPEFFQVDGVIVDEEASLVTLLGTLKEFYLKMGFERIRFKPAFYPYTEPSADVIVYMDAKKKWMEMGGSGVFRPEVTRPLGCRVPVLAWGLGLDRLAMIRYGINDIRELYWSDFDRIQEVPLCR